MTGSHGAPPVTNNDAGAGAWLPGFAFDFDIALLRAPQLPPGTSYADVARRNALPPAVNLGAAFVSSSDKGEAARRS
jgi:hypothetical protein